MPAIQKAKPRPTEHSAAHNDERSNFEIWLSQDNSTGSAVKKSGWKTIPAKFKTIELLRKAQEPLCHTGRV